MKDLSVNIGSLKLANPVMVASGTFGNVQEAADMIDLSRLGAIVPKTVTRSPRAGNNPPRTVETTAGLLNAIGLDNDGLELYIEQKIPYFRTLKCPAVVSFAGVNEDDYVSLARSLEEAGQGGGVDALEINISCPNVAHGTDFGKDPQQCFALVSAVRRACSLPLLVKLTPNVSDITVIARSAEDAGADAVSLINTVLGMAIDWRRRKPRLGNRMGGMSGPAIKPIALRMVYQVAQVVHIPIVGIGGIETIDDAMEFFVAGATAIQVGTANFYRPQATIEIIDALPQALDQLGAQSVSEIIGTLQ